MHETMTRVCGVLREIRDSPDAAPVHGPSRWAGTQEALMRHHPVVDLMPLAVAAVLFALTLAVLSQHPPIGDTGTASGRDGAEAGIMR